MVMFHVSCFISHPSQQQKDLLNPGPNVDTGSALPTAQLPALPAGHCEVKKGGGARPERPKNAEERGLLHALLVFIFMFMFNVRLTFLKAHVKCLLS